MLEREKVRSSAAIATALAVSSGNQIGSDGVATALGKSNDYACSPEDVYALPRIDLHEVEWIEPDLVDAEVSRLVAGSSTTTTTTATTRNNPRRCCRTSTSSGYSSHSPPLSAGSYSCYATPAPGQGAIRPSVPLAMRDQLGGLAVIHEGETIPRPIWPSACAGQREFCRGDDPNAEYDGLYTCGSCGCYAYSYCDWDYGQSPTSAREVLLELSRTLNSVIEGETAMTPEEILHNISLTVAQSIGLKKNGVYEYAYQNPSWMPGTRNWSASLLGVRGASQPSSRNSAKASSVNPVNSKLYSGPRHLYAHNSPWYRCACDAKSLSAFKVESTALCRQAEKKEAPEHRAGVTSGSTAPNICSCKCFGGSSQQIRRAKETGNDREQRGVTGNLQRSIVGSGNDQKALASSEPEYTTQLESSDGGSSSEGIIVRPAKGGWEHRVRGFAVDLDFTLDVTRAERLGRTIAKAKRKRQWCRALTALFGLVFFVLSVVIVSLSVTRGRKVFGSM